MSLASPYQEQYYVADGVTTSFAFGQGFTALNEIDIKCIIYFEDGTDCVPVFNVNTVTGYINIVTLTKPDGTVLTVPPAGSIVRIFRDTPEAQNVTASQLQNYTAKQLERIFDSVVAMIQEVSYSDLHKTIRLTETQRDIAIDYLPNDKDQAVIYWDIESRKLMPAGFGQNQVVKSDGIEWLVYDKSEGKIYYVPREGGNPIPVGKATIHNDLSGRNAPDCHPESAITGLTTHLQELRDKDTEIEGKADYAVSTADEAKGLATTAKNTADAAYEKAEETERAVQGFDDRITQAEEDSAYAKEAVDEHITDKDNPHEVTKDQVGLGNCDNTSDEDKPISTATQTALNGKQATISDLATIRSNAQAGKAASDTIATYGDIVTHDVAEFATAAQGAKADTAVQPADLATVATSGSYNDLSDKPTIPAEQVNSDWNANSGVAQILNKPTLATVATSGSYNDLSNKPTIPTVNDATLTIQKNGTSVATFTANASSNVTANISVPTTTSDLTNDSGFITSSALAPYALSADLATVATSGSYNDLSDKPTIPTVNNPTITITQGGVTKGSFTLNQATGDTIALDAGGGSGSVDIDNTTITKNSDDEIQAIAIIDQNTGIAKTWTGTMAEYEAIVTKDPETEYIITDDIGGSATEIGQITEALNNKVDKGHQVVEFQAPNAGNNYTWYRKYADGWVEQGGLCSGTAENNPVTMPVEMSNTEYQVSAISDPTDSVNSWGWVVVVRNSKTTTGFSLGCRYGSGSVVALRTHWEAKGMAA